MIKLSLCIPTYNRPAMTIEAFEKVYTDNRIDEIIIVDDCSHEYNYSVMVEKCKDVVNRMGINKFSIHRNNKNLGMSRNKAMALSLAKNDWCILFDSDNILYKDYLDAFYSIIPNEGDEPIKNIIYCPDFAKPNFNYKSLSGHAFTATMVAHQIASNDALNMAMNTCNYIVNKSAYLKTYKYNPDHIASDTIWFNYNWMLNDGRFYFVPGMEYLHRVHKESGFLQNAVYNMQKAEEVKKLITQL